MRTVPLSEVAAIHGGGRLGFSGLDFVAAGVPAFGAGGQNGFLPVAEYDREAVILSSIGARCGKCFYVHGRWTSLANTQVIVPDPALADARFLWHQLNDERRWPRSGTGQPFIKPSDVKTHLIGLPILSEQRRIAAILDQADAIRTKHRQVLVHLDLLPQVIFVDMFGDGKEFPLHRMMDVVVALEGGKSLVADDSGQQARNRVLKISAVTSNYFRPLEAKPLPDSYVPPVGHFVRTGDLLISRANTAELVGAVALVCEAVSGLVLPDKLWRFIWRTPQKVEPVYMWKLLQTPGMRRALSLRASGTGGSMKNISKANLMTMSVPIPPIDWQREFANRVQLVDAERLKAHRVLDAYDALFAALQSRAFRGEL